MFNSPTDWCPICKEWVALDEGIVECARAHRCRVGQCPLAREFSAQQSAKLAAGDIAAAPRGRRLSAAVEASPDAARPFRAPRAMIAIRPF
jgi:hypothetical protein